MDKLIEMREKIIKQKAFSERIYKIAVIFTFLAVPATAWLVMMIFMLLLKGIDDSFTIALAFLCYFVPLLVDLICVALWLAYKKLTRLNENLQCKLRLLWYGYALKDDD